MRHLYRVLRGFSFLAGAMIIVGTLCLLLIGPYALAMDLHNPYLLWLYAIHGVAFMYAVGCE